MTNEKLGVLLVDVPEPKYWKYNYVGLNDDRDSFCIKNTDVASWASHLGYKCAQEEAKKYPQFKWVALEEL